MQGDSGALDGARREDHSAIRVDGEKLSLAGDVRLDRVDDTAGGVQLDHVGERNQEQSTRFASFTPGRVDSLAHGFDEHGQAAELVEAEKA